MANVLVEEQSLQDIADAIREKNGTNNTYTPSQMSTAIGQISNGFQFPTGSTSYILKDFIQLSEYETYRYMGTGNIVGGGLTINSSGNNWKIYKGELQPNKLYFCRTYHDDSSDRKIVVTDENDIILFILVQGVSSVEYILDTSNFTNYNNLYIYLGVSKSFSPVLNQTPSGIGEFNASIDANGQPYVFVREVEVIQQSS